jgi:hypothetical protein
MVRVTFGITDDTQQKDSIRLGLPENINTEKVGNPRVFKGVFRLECQYDLLVGTVTGTVGYTLQLIAMDTFLDLIARTS